MYWPARYGQEATAIMALKCGADVTASYYYGWTPLHAASSNEHVEVVKLLLATDGVDANVRD